MMPIPDFQIMQRHLTNKIKWFILKTVK